MEPSSKANAKQFLKRLEQFLNTRLLPPAEMAQRIEATVKQAKASSDQRHLALPEAALVNEHVTPLIGRFLRDELRNQSGLVNERPKLALLSESWKGLPALTSGTPSRSAKHPFSKVIGIKPKQIFEQWKSTKGLTRSCPDLALRDPAPHRVVFEAKYFRRGGESAAKSALVQGIYEAFFYRGLPTRMEKPPHASWNYDYGCLLIYDGSRDGTVNEAWRSLDRQVRTACWDGANIYVMVLQGSERGPNAEPHHAGDISERDFD
jgi:hypothetical protein